MVNIGLKSILKGKRGPPGGLAGARNPTHALWSPGKQAQPTKNHENTAPARAPALISKVGHTRWPAATAADPEKNNNLGVQLCSIRGCRALPETEGHRKWCFEDRKLAALESPKWHP